MLLGLRNQINPSNSVSKQLREKYMTNEITNEGNPRCANTCPAWFMQLKKFKEQKS